MELSFRSKPMHRVSCVLREVRRQEETAEAIVPDSWPDIGSILDSHAIPVLRGKDVRDGNVIISGGIRGSILYLAEGESSLKCLEFYIPFSLKFENPSITECAGVLCDLKVASVDGRVINCRKALLRTEISCSVCIFETSELTVRTLENPPEQIRVRQAFYEPELLLETAERSFTVSDTLEFLTGNKSIDYIWRIQCTPEIKDKKIVGARAVFRGSVVCEFICVSNGKELCKHQFHIPFSQFCDLNHEYDLDEKVYFVPIVTGFDLEPDSQTDIRKAYLNVHLLVQCMVYGKRKLDLVEDAFSTYGTFVPSWDEFHLDTVLDHPEVVQGLRLKIPSGISNLVDVVVYLGHPFLHKTSDCTQIGTHITAHVLGYDHDGKVCASIGTHTIGWDIPMNENVSCASEIKLTDLPFVTFGNSEAEVHLELGMQAFCVTKQNMKTIAGGEFESVSGEVLRPSVILKRVTKGADLWQIAKSSRANEDHIAFANGLDGTHIPDDRVLLIPVGC